MPPVAPGALVAPSLYLVSSGNKGLYCALLDDTENNEASGSDTVEPTATRATQALGLSSQSCWVPLLIAESWPECGKWRPEARTEGVCCRKGWREEREESRDKAGSGRWSLIRGWTVANLPAASAQHSDHWGGRNRKHAPLCFSLSTSLSWLLLYFPSCVFCLTISESICKSLFSLLTF